jgi:hypothetical protein
VICRRDANFGTPQGVSAGAQLAPAADDQQERSQDCFLLDEESTRAPRSEGRWLARLTKGGSGPTISETASKAAGDIRPEALRTLGDLLYDHVRIEERELFAEIERIVPAAELEAVRL